MNHGLSSNKEVQLNEIMQRISASPAFIGRSMYKVTSGDGLVVGFVIASSVRFKPSKEERARIFPDYEHRITCLKCTEIRSIGDKSGVCRRKATMAE
jgi:hypothetical protein